MSYSAVKDIDLEHQFFVTLEEAILWLGGVPGSEIQLTMNTWLVWETSAQAKEWEARLLVAAFNPALDLADLEPKPLGSIANVSMEN